MTDVHALSPELTAFACKIFAQVERWFATLAFNDNDERSLYFLHTGIRRLASPQILRWLSQHKPHLRQGRLILLTHTHLPFESHVKIVHRFMLSHSQLKLRIHVS